jgi:hypothetical protein
LKIWTWLDKGINTFQKRQALFLSILSAYWLWQLVWQAMLILHLINLSDYSSLFSFLPTLQGYESSFLVRFIMSVISGGLISMSTIFQSLSSIGVLNWIMIALSLLAVFTYKKTNLIFAFMAGILIVFFFLVKTGFEASSVNEVIALLNYFGKIELVLHGLSILWFLFCFLIQLHRWISNILLESSVN